jgi:ubiquinone/menaquinone biosynthesis C-methylase UbiE
MPDEARMLTHQQATAFYDRLGAKQDWQAFYEAPATRDLIAHASFETAQSVFEFGCGTGVFAERVLARHLPPQATYLAVDSSSTMVRLAQARLARFGERVAVRQTDGSLQLDEVSGPFERFVSTFVLDLLSAADTAQLLAEAHRLLAPEGRLCLVSLTRGSIPLVRLVTWVWTRIHALQPRLVGGCRPVELLDCLPGTHWRVDYARVITRFGVPSEFVVAAKRRDGGERLQQSPLLARDEVLTLLLAGHETTSNVLL